MYIYIHIICIEYIYIYTHIYNHIYLIDLPRFSPQRRTKRSGGLGLRATKDVEPNEVALAIPLDLVLTVPVAARSIAGAGG